MNRIGIGYDIHRLEEGADLVIGGVTVDFPKGAIGHSDADALIHAVIDAILGAMNAGDIGQHFPPSDPKYKGISSRTLLQQVQGLLGQKGWQICNIDTTIILQEPKLIDYKEQMQQNLAEDLQITRNLISIKAKTKEGLDAAGRGEAIEAHAAVLLTETEDDGPPVPPEDTVWV